jgi:RimJ/RimL family protein N-acetyltransferase
VAEGRSFADIELTTRRLLLRPWRAEDASSVFEAMQHRQMHEFLSLPDPYTMQDAVSFVSEVANANRADRSGLGSAVVERASGAVVGSADLRYSKTNLLGADIGYAIYPPAQGNGYAAEATRALTEWGHTQGLNRIELRCAVTNLASAATALAAGFAFEGLHRAQLRIPSGEVASACFARLAADSGDAIAPDFPRLGVLDDGVIGLRVVQPEDAEPFWEQDADPESLRFGFRGHPASRDEVAAATGRAGLDWLVGSLASLAVVDKASGEFAGSVRLRMSGPPQVARVGYATHPAFRGRGYATRAVRLLAGWAFDVAGLVRLELGAKIENIASQRVALAAGFATDGIRTARLRNADGSFSDEARFALVRSQTVSRINP